MKIRRAPRIAFVVVVVAVGVLAAGIAILKSIDFNSYRGAVAEQVENAVGRKLAIEGDLALDISFSPSLMVEGISLGNAPWGSRPRMVTVERLAAEVELWPLLSGDVRVTRLHLDGVDILLEVDGEGRANWAFEAAAPAGGPATDGGGTAVVPLVKEVVLRNSRLAYRDAAGTDTEIVVEDLTLSTNSLNDPLAIAGRGRIGGAPMAVEGTVGSIRALVDGAGSYPLSVRASAFGAEVSAEGAVALAAPGTGLDLAVSARIDNLDATVRGAAASLPALAGVRVPAVPFTLNGRLLPSARGQALEAIQATLGDSDLAGRVVFEAAADGRPRLTADLASRRIDLAGLVSAMPDAPGAPASAPGPSANSETGRLFPADPLPLDGLRGVDAKAFLAADEIVLPGGVVLGATALELLLEKGRLRIEPMATTLADGSLEGMASLDASGPRAAAEIRLEGEGVDGAMLLEQLGVRDFLRGGATALDIRLNGDGASVREIMAGLDGEATVHMGDGSVRRRALELAGADVAMQLLDALNPLAAREEYTPLSCAVVRFQVTDGVARAENGIAVETDKVNMVGSGAVDLRAETLDFAVKPEARQGLGINIGGSLAGLVRIRGPLTEPAIGIDQAGAAKTAASIGAALATGGLSVLGQALLERQTRDPHPCRTALGQAAPPDSSGRSGDGGNESGSALEGLGKTFEGLFGGSRK